MDGSSEERIPEQITQGVLQEEIGRTKQVIGWLILKTNACFERTFLIELLKKHWEKLENKLYH